MKLKTRTTATQIEEKKALQIHKFVRLLVQSVPEEIKEDVHTELLLKGLTLFKESDQYIFKSLRNRKIDLLRGSLSKDPLVNSVRFMRRRHETMCSGEELEYAEYLGMLYVAYVYMTPVYRKFFRDIVRHARLRKEWNVKKSSKRCKFSDKRGYKVFAEIRAIFGAVAKTRNIDIPKDITNFVEFYEKITAYRD